MPVPSPLPVPPTLPSASKPLDLTQVAQRILALADAATREHLAALERSQARALLNRTGLSQTSANHRN